MVIRNTFFMKINLFISIIFFTFEIMALDIQCTISGGYGFPAARFETGPTYQLNDSGDAIKWEDGLASYGKGLKINADVTLFFNDNYGVMLGSGISMRGGYEIVREDPEVYAREVHTANYIPITTGLKLQGSNKKIQPFMYIAPGIIIPINVKGNVIFRDIMQDTVLDEIDISEKYKTGFIVCTGVGVIFKLTKLVGLTLECSPSYGSAFLKEFTREHKRNGKTHYTETIKIYRDRKNIPEDEFGPDYEKVYLHGAPYISFSSVSAKMGISFNF